MPLDPEIWKPIITFPGYEVSNHGRIKSFRRYADGQILKPGLNNQGYLTVVLMLNGKMKSKSVHRLVAETFIGKQPEGMQVSHLDGDSRNNYVTNLAWMTPSDNVRLNFDEFNHLSIKHKDKLEEVRSLSQAGISNREIGRRLKISHSHVDRIVKGQVWGGGQNPT